MAAQKQDDQHERTFSSYVRIRDVVLKTYQGRWTIGRSGERGSGISVLPARYDDDDDEKNRILFFVLYNCGRIFFSFLVGYILSFDLVRLRTIRLSACAGAHTEYSSRSRVEDVTITNVIIKTPDRKYDWGANNIMSGSDGLGFLVNLKRSS